jgi:hypothetical protein
MEPKAPERAPLRARDGACSGLSWMVSFLDTGRVGVSAPVDVGAQS